MRERWLYLLLCALLVRFNGGDNFVNGNEEALNRTSIDFSAAEKRFAFGEDSFNGSYSNSGLAKIRRVRSLEEEYEKAKNHTKDLGDKKKVAEEEVIPAAEEYWTAMNNWKKADEEYTQLIADIEKAEGEKKNATKNKNKAENDHNRIIANWRIAGEIHEETKEELAKLETKKNADAGLFNAADTIYKGAKDVEKEPAKKEKQVKIAWGKAIKQQPVEQGKHDALVGTRQISFDEKTKNDDTIANYDVYVKFTQEKTTATDNLKQLELDLPVAKKKVENLEEKKNMLDNNQILTKHHKPDWKGMTVGKALEEWGKAYEKLKPQVEIRKIFLEEIEGKAEAAALVDLVNDYDNLKKDVDENLKTEKKKVADNPTSVTTEKSAEAAAASELTKLETKMGADYATIEEDGPAAKANQQKIDDKFRIDDEAFTKSENNLKTIAEETSKLGARYRILTTVLDELKAVTASAEEKKTEASQAKEAAKAAYDTYEKLFFTPSKNEKKNKLNEIKQNEYVKNGAVGLFSEAERKFNQKKDQETEKERNKNKALTEKDDKERISVRKNSTAFTLHTDYENAFKIKEALEKKYTAEKVAAAKREEERLAQLKMLQMGLGIAVGIIVVLVVGSVIAFLIIRRRKKKAVVPVKKRKIIEVPSGDGRVIRKEEGEMDKYIIKGESFVDMPGLVGRNWTEQDLGKHLLDDQVGGDKLDKITFTGPMQVYQEMEARWQGEEDGVSIADDVDHTEGRPSDDPEYEIDRKHTMEMNKEREAEYQAKKKRIKMLQQPSSSEEKKPSDEKKSNKKMSSSSKSKKSSDTNTQTAPSSPSDGKKKSEKQKKK